jgi:hypothetical protein
MLSDPSRMPGGIYLAGSFGVSAPIIVTNAPGADMRMTEIEAGDGGRATRRRHSSSLISGSFQTGPIAKISLPDVTCGFRRSVKELLGDWTYYGVRWFPVALGCLTLGTLLAR